MKAKWRITYDGQLASWIVYRGNMKLYDYYPTKAAALAAAKEKNQEARQ